MTIIGGCFCERGIRKQIVAGLLDGEVRLAEVDEEVPLDIIHSKQVLHGLEVDLEKTRPAPDGGVAPAGQAHVGEPLAIFQAPCGGSLTAAMR